MVSRVDKCVREILGTASLSDASRLRQQPVTIEIGSDPTGKYSLMAEACVETALRCMKGPINVWIEEPAGMRERLASVEKRYDTTANSRVREIHERARDGFVIRLGVFDGAGVLADAAGWTAGVNAVLPREVPASAPAWAFAVACAFAKAFGKSVLGIEGRSAESLSFCLRTFSRSRQIIEFSERSLSLGTITLLGGGAIGGGFAYVADRSGWSGEVHIIDRDSYDEPNEETTMLVPRTVVLCRHAKAEALAKLLGAEGRFACRPSVSEVTETSSVLAERRDVFVVAVDNASTRRVLDNVNAALVLNGGLSGHAHTAGQVLWTRHIHNDLPLSSYYRYDDGGERLPSYPSEILDACSRVRYEGASLAAPFLPLACGSLLVAACAGERLGVNYLKFDLLGLVDRFDRRTPPP